jgi:arylsulfatase A-like enzyme
VDEVERRVDGREVVSGPERDEEGKEESEMIMRSPLNPVRLVAAFAVFSFALRAAESRPNVIVILADDLGYGSLGCYGDPKNKTPHLDRMAKEGVRFTHFNTPAPFCAPTRASLLTGRYPFRCGMTANPAPDGGPAADDLALPQSEVLLPQVFKGAGYATAMIGKWHLGHKRRESLPMSRGFDEYFGILYSNDMRPVQLIDGEKPPEYPLVQATITRRYTTRALDFIERNRTKPFFLYLAHAMPHKPLATTEQFYQKSGAGLYADVMADLDASVGEVLAKVKALGLDERTFVIFTSDNGPWYGGSSGGLRNMKGSSWEGGYRVPFIARWPGRIPAGRETAALCVTMDIFATSLAAAGIKAPADRVIDGKDILPVLISGAASPHDYVFGHQGPRLATVRDARWKLHVLTANERRDGEPGQRWIDPRGPDGVTMLAPYEQYQPTVYPGLRTGDEGKPGALFDLQNDPGEQRDVAAANLEIVARLRKAYDEMNRDVPAAPPGQGGKQKGKK